MIKYIKSVLWKAAKRLSYIEDARCLKVKQQSFSSAALNGWTFNGNALSLRLGKTLIVYTFKIN